MVKKMQSCWCALWFRLKDQLTWNCCLMSRSDRDLRQTLNLSGYSKALNVTEASCGLYRTRRTFQEFGDPVILMAQWSALLWSKLLHVKRRSIKLWECMRMWRKKEWIDESWFSSRKETRPSRGWMKKRSKGQRKKASSSSVLALLNFFFLILYTLIVRINLGTNIFSWVTVCWGKIWHFGSRTEERVMNFRN